MPHASCVPLVWDNGGLPLPVRPERWGSYPRRGMGGSLGNRQRQMTNEKPLSKETRDELEQAADEMEAEKEQRRREERREQTKYGGLIEDE